MVIFYTEMMRKVVFTSEKATIQFNYYSIEFGKIIFHFHVISIVLYNLFLQAYYPKTADEVRRNVYKENMFLLKPSETLNFYRTFTPQKFLYYAVYVPKTALMAVNVSRSVQPYAQELFDYLKGLFTIFCLLPTLFSYSALCLHFRWRKLRCF